ncbi:MAG: RnfABCDGE type electron transport complex subunit G [Lachnospiraceae bacterium]|nr:RnfABCDGE type electron transport complex subunit G [Lachnospiraceae bacterium]
MNKDLNSALKDALILVVITLVSGLLLGLVNMLTEEPIRLQKEQAVVDSCKAVFPAGDYPSYELSFVLTDLRPSEMLQNELLQNGVTVGNIYAAVSPGGMTEGFAIEVTSSEGYGGDIRLMCGVDTYGTIKGVSILEISETAGLGMRAGDVLVPQLRNLNVDHIVFTKTGKTSDNEIDAISGATVTTTAFVNCVNAALDVFEEMVPAEGGAA